MRRARPMAAGRPDLHDELGVDGVARLHGGVDQVHATAALALVVPHVPRLLPGERDLDLGAAPGRSG